MTSPRQLPPGPEGGMLFGRSEELGALTELLRAGGTVTVGGLPGMGKTALAAAAIRGLIGDDAKSLAASPWPDGVLWLGTVSNLAPAATWDAIADTLGGSPARGESAESRARKALAGKRVLLAMREDAWRGDRTRSVCDPANTVLVVASDTDVGDAGVALTEGLTSDDAFALLRRLIDVELPQAADRLVYLADGSPQLLTAVAQALGAGADPVMLGAAWAQADIAPLYAADPHAHAGCLRWLRDSRLAALGTAERKALVVAGMLADAPFRAADLSAGLGGDASQALSLLEKSGLMVRSTDDGEWWLGKCHEYARVWCAGLVPGAERWAARERLSSWLREQFERVTPQPAGVARRRARSLLLHLQAVAAIADHPTFDEKAFAHEAIRDRITGGDLALADVAMDMVMEWLEGAERLRAFVGRRHAESLANSASELARSGDHAGALSRYDAARALLDPIVRSGRPAALERKRLYDVLVDRARLLDDMDDFAGAEASCTAAIDILLPAGNPQYLVDALQFAADLRLRHGDLSGAETIAERARDVSADHAAAVPDDARLRFDAAGCEVQLGDIRRARGDLTRAEESFQAAAFVIDNAGDPETLWDQATLASLVHQLGFAYVEMGDLDRGVQRLGEARVTREALAAHEPGRATWRAQLALTCRRLAEAHYAAGDPGAARMRATESLALLENLAAGDPSRAEWRQRVNEVVELVELIKQAGR